MKFSRFLLRQGCGGQAASKDGVVFILRFAYRLASRLDFFLLRCYITLQKDIILWLKAAVFDRRMKKGMSHEE
jgi:hypothetical protein